MNDTQGTGPAGETTSSGSSRDTADAHSAGDNAGTSAALTAVLSVLAVAMLLAAVAAGGWWFVDQRRQSAQPPVIVRSEPPVPDGVELGEQERLTGFTLTQRSGESFDSRSLEGQVWVASFFYSSCRHTCLQLNQQVHALQQEFAPRGVKFVSITCDPAIDTPAVLDRYASGFEGDLDGWLFLTGNGQYIARIGQDLFQASAAPKTHSNRVFIVDRRGELAGALDALDPTQFRQARLLIQRLLEENRSGGLPDQSPPAAGPPSAGKEQPTS